MISPDLICATGIVPIKLEQPIGLQLACIGSKSTINYGARSTITFGTAHVEEYFDIANICYVPCRGYPSPGFGSGRTWSLDGHGFSEQVAALTRLSRPGFQSRTDGSSRGATVGRAERREATSAEWAVFHGDDIR